MRNFLRKQPKDDAARNIGAATSSVHAEQHALHRNHGGRLDYHRTASRELLLLATSTVLRIR